jgi:subtilisin family serine protease
MKKTKNVKILSFLIICLLFLTIFSSIASSFKVEKYERENNEKNDFIIELIDKPSFMYFNCLKKERGSFFSKYSDSFLKNKVESYRSSLLNSHEQVISSILALADEKDQTNIVFSRQYTGIFNGFFIKNITVSLVEKIKNLPFVKNVYPNYKFSVCLAESVPLIKATEAWNVKDKIGRNITGQGINIAILDTGIDYMHPSLQNSYTGGYDFVNDDDDPMDDHGHGTHCAGIITGDKINSNYPGVAPDSNIYAFKVLDSQGSGDLNNYLAALDAAADPNGDGDPSDHVDILSISFGTNQAGSPDDIVSLKADEMVDMGIIVIAAAGNNGPAYNSITSPGCSLKSITVGSINKNSQISSTSSRGPVELNGSYYIKPDVVAPGVQIKSTYLDGRYAVMSGTSMAAPHAAGATALLLQANPDLTHAEVKQILKDSAFDLGENGDDNTYGSGRINILNALNPPVAFLNISSRISHGLVEIKGSARNSSGTADDFINYSLYYYESSWVKIFENDKEVDNDILYIWNTTNLTSGLYKLKLEVKCINQTNVIVKNLVIGYNDKPFVVSFPKIVNESSIFQVKITDFNGTPIKAFVILFSPFNLPRIKYGSEVDFKAPLVHSSVSESKKGKIVVIRLLKGERVTEEITIVNS